MRTDCDSRMNRTASPIGILLWPPAVFVACIVPSSTQRFTDDSLTPIAWASSRGVSIAFMLDHFERYGRFSQSSMVRSISQNVAFFEGLFR